MNFPHPSHKKGITAALSICPTLSNHFGVGRFPFLIFFGLKRIVLNIRRDCTVKKKVESLKSDQEQQLCVDLSGPSCPRKSYSDVCSATS